MATQSNTMALRPEFLDPDSPAGLEVYDLAPNFEKVGLIYPDRRAFLEDGRRMLLGVDRARYICHLDEGGRLEPMAPLTPGIMASWDSELSTGGRYLVYRATPTGMPEDQLLIRRLDFRTNQVEDVFSATGTLPGTSIQASKFSIQTVSWDGNRLAGTVYLGDGKTRNADFGIVILDIPTQTAKVIFTHPYLCNTHLQYSRQPKAPDTHDLIVQMNHGCTVDEAGKMELLLGPPSDLGVDVHIVRDDGTNWRDLPFGRDGKESTIGHQIWRGQSQMGATITLQNNDTSYGWADGTRQEIVAGYPVPADPAKPHLGRIGREEKRVLLSKNFQNPRFCHLSTNATGLRISLDTFPIYKHGRVGMLVYIGQAKDLDSPLDIQYLLNSGIKYVDSYKSGTHAHPILSPNGQELFFNSNWTGTHKAYMVRNLPWKS